MTGLKHPKVEVQLTGTDRNAWGSSMGGRLADRYRAHRVVLVLGNFGLALAWVAYGFSSGRGAILVLDAVLLEA